MTSLINPSNIDITYPIAGQDNDTQGFRTNFQNIRNNFLVASNEITAAQSSVATLQAQVYGNANVAAYLPHYTGNISAGNLNVTSVTYTNQEIVTTSEIITGNLDAGNTTVNGNLTTTGTRIVAGYQYYAPTTNFTYTVNNNVYKFIMDPTGAITNGNVLLPSANIDATLVSISSTQTITNFKVTPNNGTTLVPSANITLTGGTSVEYFYHAVEAKWYKVR